MTKEEKYYLEIIAQLSDAVSGQLFGKPCAKINGKAFICFFQQEMVFKLHGADHTEALSLSQSKLFDPSGKGRAMKEWVQVSWQHKALWLHFAKAALQYVNG